MEIPIRFLPTQVIAPETFLIRQLAGEGLGPLAHPLNSMVIRGAEPVIVDTGIALTSAAWMEHAFEIVDPEDVRWIYLSHDDSDHTGSLGALIDRCPQATIVTDWFMIARMAGDIELPLERLRLLNPGESFVAGDRTITAHIPPVFDSPTTRGLHDASTGVYWAADAFASAIPAAVDDVADIDPAVYEESFLYDQRLLSPWQQWLDGDRYRAHLDGLRAMDASVVVGCHGVATHGAQIDRAFELLTQLPDLAPATRVGQMDLEVLLALLGAVPAAA
jgi:flavorubredoxin